MGLCRWTRKELSFDRQSCGAIRQRLTGGGAKSLLWRQITANIFNCPVVRPAVEESGAFGAALQALWCSLKTQGENATIAEITDRYVNMEASADAMPDAKAEAHYNELFEQYLALDRALRPLYL